jgi:hypothetical protein
MNKKVLSLVEGSLPLGGWVDNVPIYGVDCSNFRWGGRQNKTNKINIDLPGTLAFTVTNVMTHFECQQLIQISESLGFRNEAPGIRTDPGMRMNQTVHWVATDNVLLPTIFKRIQKHLPPVLDGKLLFGRLSHRINVFKYIDGDVFNDHTDGDGPGFGIDEDGDLEEWSTCHSKLSMLVYLTDSAHDMVQGGATRLYVPSDANSLPVPAPQAPFPCSESIPNNGIRGSKETVSSENCNSCGKREELLTETPSAPLIQPTAFVDVEPVKGHALFFRHGGNNDKLTGPQQEHASVLHKGLQVHGDQPKYVARINVLYVGIAIGKLKLDIGYRATCRRYARYISGFPDFPYRHPDFPYRHADINIGLPICTYFGKNPNKI